MPWSSGESIAAALGPPQMTITQLSREAAERYFSMRVNAPDHADRSLPEIISSILTPTCKWALGEWDYFETSCGQSFHGDNVPGLGVERRFCQICGGEIEL